MFANVVLVDEINRASPKTQSGLLECMQERHVTVDKHTHDLARPFIVLATQNPIEYEGTYPLPEAQLDRFMVRVSLGYPSDRGREGHAGRRTRDRDRVLDLEPVTGVAEVLAAQAAVAARARQRGPAALHRRRILDATRADPRVELGASPRAGPDAVPRRQGAGRPRRAATTRCPTTCRRWLRRCSPTGCCWRPRPPATIALAVVRDALDRVPAL